jgi:hypothetical protein
VFCSQMHSKDEPYEQKQVSKTWIIRHNAGTVYLITCSLKIL